MITKPNQTQVNLKRGKGGGVEERTRKGKKLFSDESYVNNRLFIFGQLSGSLSSSILIISIVLSMCGELSGSLSTSILIISISIYELN